MKSIFRLLICFFSLLSSVELKSQTQKVIETPFDGGEWFEFRIYYGFFNASYASIKLENDTINNIPVLHSMGYGKTTGLARWFFKVDDYYESYFDREKIVPYKFIRNIYEGGYNKNIEINLNKESIFKKSDVIIDFTTPKCTFQILKIASKLKKKVVIGTTGFTEKDEKIIKKYSKQIPILKAGNMSLGINLLMYFYKIVKPSWGLVFCLKTTRNRSRNDRTDPLHNRFLVQRSLGVR